MTDVTFAIHPAGPLDYERPLGAHVQTSPEGERRVIYAYADKLSDINGWWSAAGYGPGKRAAITKKETDGLVKRLCRIADSDEPASTDVENLFKRFGSLRWGEFPRSFPNPYLELGGHRFSRPHHLEGSNRELFSVPVDDVSAFARQIRDALFLGAVMRKGTIADWAQTVRALGTFNPDVAKDLESMTQSKAATGFVFIAIRNALDDWVTTASDAFGWRLAVSFNQGEPAGLVQATLSMPAMAIAMVIASLRVRRSGADCIPCARPGCGNLFLPGFERDDGTRLRTLCEKCLPMTPAERKRKQRQKQRPDVKRLEDREAQQRRRDRTRRDS